MFEAGGASRLAGCQFRSYRREVHWALISAFLLAAVSPLAFTDEVVSLPDNLEQIIAEKISGVSPEEKEMIGDWSPGKKLAEFFCQETALKELGKSYSGADRVFLSMSDDEPPRFVSENRIEGSGSVRHNAGWTDIRYQCEIELHTGKPNEFLFSEIP